MGDAFEVEALINVRVAKAGARVAEVPSCERIRHSGASNPNAFSDGIRVMRTIHAERKGAVLVELNSVWGFQTGLGDFVVDAIHSR